MDTCSLNQYTRSPRHKERERKELTLMIRPRQKLRTHIIRAPYETLTLHLTNHITSPLFRQVLQTLFNRRLPLRLLRIIQQFITPSILRTQITKSARFLLDGYTFVGEFLDTFLENGSREHGGDHVFGESGVEDWLADVVVVGAPAGAGYMEGDFAEEPVWIP